MPVRMYSKSRKYSYRCGILLCQALSKAWSLACASPQASRIVIPPGIYAMGQISLEGPCKSPVNLIVKGNIRCPVDTSKFKPVVGWISFQHLDGFTLSGYGVFDGQGTSLWGRKCDRSRYCNQLPIVSFRYVILLQSCLCWKIH